MTFVKIDDKLLHPERKTELPHNGQHHLRHELPQYGPTGSAVAFAAGIISLLIGVLTGALPITVLGALVTAIGAYSWVRAAAKADAERRSHVAHERG